MSHLPRKAAFVVAATDQGSLIVNRFDYHALESGATIGVGHHLLESCRVDADEVGVGAAMLDLAHIFRGDGVVAIDCGANIGVHTVEWARLMTGWGRVLAFEAQERLFYALAGNLALNNCFNAQARHAAVAANCGVMRVPVPDYLQPGSFGSLEMRPRPNNEFIGQEVDYSDTGTTEIACLSLDSLALPRVDLIKIDVEAMEMEVLAGARETIERQHPLLIVESLKADQAELQGWLENAGYQVLGMGNNFVAVHGDDPIRPYMQPNAA